MSWIRTIGPRLFLAAAMQIALLTAIIQPAAATSGIGGRVFALKP